MKFIHSADWQLGARFAQFGAQSEALRQARLSTLRTALNAARDQQADAFIIAGDLFEDNQVDDSLVAAVLGTFQEFGSVPIFILPGNHDPNTGPDSVWSRRLFGDGPSHVTVFREPKALAQAGGYLIASPLAQKVSTIDPSRRLAGLARDLPADAIKVGITHGALAIPGRHQPNDFPIDLAAATRAGLDYLAVGHWHNWQVYDQGRLVMPGTPEPDNFDQTDSGFVACVEIKGHGVPPDIQKLSVASMRWEPMDLDFLDVENARQKLQQRLSALRDSARRTIVRLTLTGNASPALLESTQQWLHSALAPFLVTQIVDQSSVALTPAELQQLQQDHPLLAHVLADIVQLEHLLTGARPPAGHDSSATISLVEAQQLTAGARIDLNALKSSHFNLARRVLLQKLREVGA